MSRMDDLREKLLASPWVVGYIINLVTNSTSPRPHPFSLWAPRAEGETPDQYLNSVSDYTSWIGLFDKTYTKRHLPPASEEFIRSLPPLQEVLKVFERPLGNDEALPAEKLSDSTSMLFPFFAQWFTDSFLRTDPHDWHKNTSNHQIDLCQIYGLTETTTELLRLGQGGKLKYQIIDGGEYFPYLCEENADGQVVVKEEFKGLPRMEEMLQRFEQRFVAMAGLGEEEQKRRKLKFFVAGLDRANSSVGYTLMNTIFLRAHNRICDRLGEAYGAWDDNRLFHTARNILTVILLKIVVIDYVNHISGDAVRVMPSIGFADKQKWYRENWIAVEFDLLYRWHTLIRNKIAVQAGGEPSLTYKEFMYNPALIAENDAGSIAVALSQQAAGAPGLFNTPDFLMPVKEKSLQLARNARLMSFNEYRKAFGIKPLRSYEDLSTTDESRQALKKLYANDINKLELLPGLWAESASAGMMTRLFNLRLGLFGETMNTMVGVDAFSQALTNPLLSANVYNARTFSAAGLEIIDSINSLEQLINMTDPKTKGQTISFRLKH